MTDQHIPTTQLNITTLNVNGLHDDNKRKKTYEMMINRKIEIAFLQETHSTPDPSKKWKKEWLGISIWHHVKNQTKEKTSTKIYKTLSNTIKNYTSA